MYVPKHNREEDPTKLLAFMQAYSFATLVTAHDGVPRATHLPFVVEQVDEQVRLTAHMAKANDQWKDFADDKEVLVIFAEPHAYISPRHYERPLSVPTWNYVAVHAYGRVNVCDAPAEQLRALEKLIRHNDADYLNQLRELPTEFISAKLKGIVAFVVAVTRLEARFKLSQDRSEREQQNIIAALRASPDEVKASIGALMQQNLRETREEHTA